MFIESAACNKSIPKCEGLDFEDIEESANIGSTNLEVGSTIERRYKTPTFIEVSLHW